ncbi:hypothetical protein AGIG_G12996 [Arapaima gigas]
MCSRQEEETTALFCSPGLEPPPEGGVETHRDRVCPTRTEPGRRSRIQNQQATGSTGGASGESLSLSLPHRRHELELPDTAPG